MKVISVNISKEKGTIKRPVERIDLTGNGIEDDAHAGDWNRQVSLLARESFERFAKIAKRMPDYGEFAENITTEGLVLHTLNLLDRLTIGEVILEVTQIGKECHGDSCAIYRETGQCIMPTEGIFCRVVKGGTIKAGEEITVEPRVMRSLVITLSNRAYQGTYRDKSGPAITKILSEYFAGTSYPAATENILIPDDAMQLEHLITTESASYDYIITTGGTGIGSEDITVDVVAPLLHKKLPGIMERIRIVYGANNPHALLSRSIAGVMDKTLIFTLPGSVKAVKEYMEEIKKIMIHALFMVWEIDVHHHHGK